jgi:hypothetical protein
MSVNMSTTLKIAAWKSWRPAEHFQEYFDHRVEPDEQAAIPFQIEFLRRAGRAYPRALEYGCGPTLMRALAASAYVWSLDMADRLEDNLRRVRLWAAGVLTPVEERMIIQSPQRRLRLL